MVTQQQTGADEPFVRRYDYGDEWVIAADVGTDGADIDVVDGTAIVVVDGRTEVELSLPGTVESVDTNNGVVEVRGE